MKSACPLRFMVATLSGLLLVGSARADITFGSDANAFTMSFVTIGAPGTGGVGYTYQMGKYEVSEDMITKANTLGNLGITKDTRGTDKPATSVSWNEAARFVNWLNTSQGFQAAYKFATQPGEMGYSANSNILLWDSGDAGYNAANPFRNSSANYFLPSADEWYKAAYFNPTTSTYSAFSNGLNTAPTAVTGGTATDTAVYAKYYGPGAVSPAGPADINQAGGTSPFGVMGLGGNVWEWQETEADLGNNDPALKRGVRGGSWLSDSNFLLSSAPSFDLPTVEGGSLGFRVASLSPAAVPELGSLCVWSVGAVCGLAWSRRRLKK